MEQKEQIDLLNERINEQNRMIYAMKEIIGALVQKYGVDPNSIRFKDPKER